MVTANFNECNFRKPMHDIKKFCNTPQIDKDAKNLTPQDGEEDDSPKMKTDICSFGTILSNFSKNAFVLMGKSSNMAETFKEWPAENPDQLMVQSMELGDDFGTFLRVGLDYMSP